MPTKSETAINRALSAAELSTILRRDFDALLARDGMLSSSTIAFGRVAYEIRITLHLANPAYPEHRAAAVSRRFSRQEVSADPILAVVEPPPLAPEPDPLCAEESCGMPRSAHDPVTGAYVDPGNPGLYHDFVPPSPPVVHAVERHRDIPSPNLVRIQHQIPVTIERRGLDGKVTQEQVVYPAEIAESEGPQPVDTDVSEQGGGTAG